MTRNRLALIIAGVMLMSLPQIAAADGAGAYQPSPNRAPGLTKEQRAIEAYNDGYAQIQRADAATELKQAEKAYQAALKKFSAAVKLDPSMHEAYTYMGYANRKLGQHEQALTSYNEALRISPEYPQAIEYQGEAFLGLNRIDDAKNNYLRLYALHQGQAHKLLRAINTWAEAKRAQPPAQIDVTALQAWVSERERSHDPNDLKTGW